MHRIIAVVAICAAVALTGCGGTDWNTAKTSAVKAARDAKAAQSPAAKAAEAKAERPLIAALIANSNAGATAAEAAVNRCAAAAIVHGYGAAAFRARGITANALRKPKSTLDALPDPTPVQVAQIGSALQRCNVRVVVAAMAIDFSVSNPATIACVAGHLGTGPDGQLYLVTAALNRKMTLAAAHSEIDVISSCVDIATLVVHAENFPGDAAFRTCVANQLHGNDAALKDYFALKLSNTDPTTAQQAFVTVSVAINHCRPGAHSGFTVPAG